MADVILVVLGRPEAAASLLTAAERFIDRVGGSRIIVLAICSPVSAASMVTQRTLTEEAISLFVAEEQERMLALRNAYENWTNSLAIKGITARWVFTTAAPQPAIEECARGADFIVIARPAADDDEATREAFNTALFETERAVLLVPPAPLLPFGRRIAIAWRDDEHAGKAVTAALRFLGGAEQLHILAGTREGQPPTVIPRILDEYHARTNLHRLPIVSRPFGKVLLTKAHELGVDLIVMGAYYHSPFHELIFGGVTRYMLAHADLPLLIHY